MLTRALMLSLLAGALIPLPVVASQPDGLAGELIADDFSSNSICPLPPNPPMEMLYLFPQVAVFNSDDTVRVEMAIIPFRQGGTVLSMDEGSNGYSIVGIVFRDGLVAGLPYGRQTWNDVVIEIRPATQDYVVTVNGARSAPQAFPQVCSPGCFSLVNIRFSGDQNGPGAIAWIDTLSAVRTSPSEYETLLDEGFDSCDFNQPFLRGGGVVLATPPQRTKPKP